MRYLERFLGLLVFLGVVACETPISEEGCISLEEAEQIVLSDVLNYNVEGIIAYELKYRLNQGDTIVVIDEPPYVFQYVVEEESWFFFIDDSPKDRWAHPCRYVLVYCDGKHKTIKEDLPPTINIRKDLVQVDFQN